MVINLYIEFILIYFKKSHTAVGWLCLRSHRTPMIGESKSNFILPHRKPSCLCMFSITDLSFFDCFKLLICHPYKFGWSFGLVLTSEWYASNTTYVFIGQPLQCMNKLYTSMLEFSCMSSSYELLIPLNYSGKATNYYPGKTTWIM